MYIHTCARAYTHPKLLLPSYEAPDLRGLTNRENTAAVVGFPVMDLLPIVNIAWSLYPRDKVTVKPLSPILSEN